MYMNICARFVFGEEFNVPICNLPFTLERDERFLLAFFDLAIVLETIALISENSLISAFAGMKFV